MRSRSIIRPLTLWATLSAATAACDKSSSSTPVTDAGAAPAVTSASASASASTASTTAPAGPTNWAGKYATAAGTFFDPRDAGDGKSLNWSGEDAGAGLGEGTMALSIDPKTNRVSGTGAGPLGDVTVIGLVADGRLTAKVLRKDPQDRGLTGTAVAQITGDKMDGEMKLSSSDAQILRAASFTLTKSP